MMGRLQGRSAAELRDRAAHALRLARERAGLSRALREPDERAWRRLLAAGAINDVARGAVEGARTLLPGLRDRDAVVALLRRDFPEHVAAVLARADAVLAGRFALLGHEALDFGSPPDWQLDPLSGRRADLRHWSRLPYLDWSVVGDHKVVWELSRHQWLVTLAQAHLLRDGTRELPAIAAHLADWMDRNPAGRGMNWASSLEVAFRAIAWLHLLGLVGERLPPPLVRRMVGMLHRHGRHLEDNLSTWFSPNTHLTGEALGLVYLGRALPMLRDAAGWHARGLDVLMAEPDRQVRPDGVHFEQATYYHRYTADFYLHVALLHDAAGEARPEGLDALLAGLLDYLVAIMRPNRTWPLIGDEDGGRLAPLNPRAANDFRDTLALGAAVLGRPDYCSAAGGSTPEVAWLAGGDSARLEAGPWRPEPARIFPDSGYAVVQSPATQDWLLFEAGPHGALSGGHAHADALAIEVAVGGSPVVADAGTLTYVSDPGLRGTLRATSSHAAPGVAGESSAVPAGAFRWATRAEARFTRWAPGDGVCFMAGRHDGYARLTPPVVVEREILWLAALRAWIIRDRLLPGEPYRLVQHFPGAAGSAASLTAGGGELRSADGATLAIRPLTPGAVVGSRRLACSPCFGRRVDTDAIDVTVPPGAEAWSVLLAEPGQTGVTVALARRDDSVEIGFAAAGVRRVVRIESDQWRLDGVLVAAGGDVHR